MKKRGFGVGKWNGPGGKVDKGEEIIVAASRETREETGLNPSDLQYRGILEFQFQDQPSWDNKCSVYTSKSWTGTLEETEGNISKNKSDDFRNEATMV